jgi:tRNA-guanine family transglycosylase
MTGSTPNGGGIWKYILHASEHGLLRRNLPALSQVLHFLDFTISPKSLDRWRERPLRQHYNGNLSTPYKLNYAGDIFLDSGGYTLMFDPNLDLSEFGIHQNRMCEGILELQIQLGATFAASLDYPIPPGLDSDEAKRRQQLNLKSAIAAARLVATRETSTKLYAPIHGSSPEHLAKFVKKLVEKLNAEGLTKYVYGLALGSMVPRRKRGNFDEVIEFAKAARRTMPAEMQLHVFGVTGVMVPYLLAEGVNSSDSSRYVQDARSLKYLNPDGRRALSWKHLAAYPCQCRVCRDRDIDEDREIMSVGIDGRQKSEVYAAIALHNLELDLAIMQEAVDAKTSGTLEKYIQTLPKRFPRLHLPKPDSKCGYTPVAGQQTIRNHSCSDYDLRRRRWKPNEGTKIALILPCSREKPYTRSRSFRAVYTHLESSLEEVELAQIELIFFSGLYGPVPEAHVFEEPVTTYDFLLHKKDTIGTAEISKRLSSFLDRFSNHYNQVVAYSTQPAYRRAVELAFMGREDVKLLPEKGRNVRTSFYKAENIEDLTKFLKLYLYSD